MSKRTGSEVQEVRETKKAKSDESKLKEVLAELFEKDPETNELTVAATDEEIKKLEEELGLTIPASYRQLLKFTNGGDLFKNYFKLEDGSYAVIAHISGIFEDEDGSVLKSKTICQELELGNNYAILSGAAPEYFGLDYTANSEEPAVVSILAQDGLQITKLAPNFETFLFGLERREEDALFIALKSTTPADQLEATIVAKLKEAGVEIKTEEELLQMQQDQLAQYQGDMSSGESDEENSGDDDGAAAIGEVGARTNDVRDLGDSGEGSDSDDGSLSEGDGELPEGFGAFAGGDFEGFDFADSEDDGILRQVVVEPLQAEEYPKQSALGFNLIFTFAMVSKGPFDDLVTSIKNVLQTVEGVEQILVVAEPVDSESVKHAFC
jgi:hypothetical protein